MSMSMTTGVFFSAVWVLVFNLEAAADDLGPPNLKVMGLECIGVSFLLELAIPNAAAGVVVFSLDVAAGSFDCRFVIVLLDSFSGIPDFSFVASLVVFFGLGKGGMVECSWDITENFRNE